MTSKVYVTQEVKRGIDYSPARKFGKLAFVTAMDFSSEDGSLLNQVLVDEIRARLRDFDAVNDFVVITGSPLVTAAVFMILRERHTGVKILRWSNRDFTYSVVNIRLC